MSKWISSTIILSWLCNRFKLVQFFFNMIILTFSLVQHIQICTSGCLVFPTPQAGGLLESLHLCYRLGIESETSKPMACLKCAYASGISHQETVPQMPPPIQVVKVQGLGLVHHPEGPVTLKWLDQYPFELCQATWQVFFFSANCQHQSFKLHLPKSISP